MKWNESVEKQSGCTWIEVNNKVHTLVVMKTTLRWLESMQNWRDVRSWMHDAGHVPYTKFVLHDVEEEEKVFHLCDHMRNWLFYWVACQHSSPNSTPNDKNLQICEDCHTSTKFIQKIVVRAIMVRDASHFQCFWGWCLFLHGLLVMPVVSLVNHNIKFLLFVACLVASLHHHSWTPLSGVVYLNMWPWCLCIVLISCLYQLYHAT
jgi:hypothetical protein